MFKIFGGRTPATPPQEARHDKQQKGQGTSSIIESADWAASEACVGAKAHIRFKLHKMPANANATIQVRFHAPTGKVSEFDNPITVKVTAKEMTASWDAKAPKMGEWKKGTFSFKLDVDNDYKISGALRLSENPVARRVQEMYSTGFEPAKK